jgi:DNA ligase 1
MKAFAELYRELDETTKTTAKVAALAQYFAHEPPADAAWAIYFLMGRKPRQVIPSRRLAEWASSEGGIPDWLFLESYSAVGDLAETIALLLPPPERSSDRPLAEWVEQYLLPLSGVEESIQRSAMLAAWAEMDSQQRLVWNKLISGGFRVGVSKQLVIRGIAQAHNLEATTIAHRLMGDWTPSAAFVASMLESDAKGSDISRPFPFFLAHPIEGSPTALGEPSEWQAEWKWDGIRGQLIRRAGRTFLWSRGEELVTDRYPELAEVGSLLPDGTAVDGEIMPWKSGKPLPFAILQRRIGRKTLTKPILTQAPVALVAFDLLEDRDVDVRSRPLAWRRERLNEIAAHVDYPERFIVSPIVQADTWDALALVRATSREQSAEGLMLKRRSSPYGVGRVRGDWWKWKLDPYTIDAVLTAAQVGHGKRASLYTDYTFSVWDGDRLVPIAKAYSGLTDEEIQRVDAFVRQHMIEKFGPVRTVKPELVFELGFEGIQRSTRHKSGVAVRFPRILRWRTDKTVQEADSVETLRSMLPPECS